MVWNLVLFVRATVRVRVWVRVMASVRGRVRGLSNSVLCRSNSV
jgi:hypothetical protein